MKMVMKPPKWVFGLFGMAIILLLLIPSAVNAKSCERAVAGIYGEDPIGREAFHPEICSYGSYVVMTYTMETNQPNPYGAGNVYNIRIAFSFNSGATWSHFEWVSYNIHVNQDYSDVRIFMDHTIDQIRIVVTWQEKPIDGSGPWEIKARERNNPTIWGTWGSVYQVSDSSDNRDNIYPKIDTLSTDNGVIACTYWPIVWQRNYPTNTYGIKLNIFFIDSQQLIGGFRLQPQDVAVPASSNYNYRHPAIASNYISNADAELHIVYDATISTGLNSHQIRVESGYVNHFVNVPNQIYTPYTHNPNPQIISSASMDINIGFPDIASCGPGGGGGHPVNPGQAHIALVWRGVNNGNRVYLVESTDSGVNYGSTQTVSSNGAPDSLRSVAVAIDEQFNNQISVVYTNGNDIWFRKKVNNNPWAWIAEEQWTNDGNTDDFVDVYIRKPSGTTFSHVCWQESIQTVWYARDP
mgnify:CR=1 FL=1